MTKDFADAFAAEWVSAWNAHDVGRVLFHYTEDCTIESPMAEQLCPGSDGTVHGKAAVRQYWTTGLEKNQALHFELVAVFVGVHSVALLLHNSTSNKKSVELMTFNKDGMVYKAVVCFAHITT